MLDDICTLIVVLIAIALPLAFAGLMVYFALRTLYYTIKGERDPLDVAREERELALDRAYWEYAAEQTAEKRLERLRQERIDTLLEYAVDHIKEEN